MRKAIYYGLLSLGILFGVFYGSAISISAFNIENLPEEVDLVRPQSDIDAQASTDATAQPQEVIEPSEPEYVVIRRYMAVSSWYRHGKVTANGERYDPNGLTVAHRRLPFNTLVRFTNPNNGRVIIARVNDRGPYIHGREFDLSMGSAQLLGFIEKGVVRLEVEILR